MESLHRYSETEADYRAPTAEVFPIADQRELHKIVSIYPHLYPKFARSKNVT